MVHTRRIVHQDSHIGLYELRFVLDKLLRTFATNQVSQREPGKGDWKDLETWQYFGLVRNRQTGACELDEKPFCCPDGRDKDFDCIISGREIDDIRKQGKSHSRSVARTQTMLSWRSIAMRLIYNAEKYDLFKNNCQNFAANLLLRCEAIQVGDQKVFFQRLRSLIKDSSDEKKFMLYYDPEWMP
jgi:hypothetical protein